MINANDFLFRSIPIGGEEYAGLNFPREKTLVVPGNHDAWNAGQSGSLLSRRQRSLDNFNFAFNSHKMPTQDGCKYSWLQKGNTGVFFACVDSCFLGDTEHNSDSPFGTMLIDQVAKGKLSLIQTEKLLEWHDLGVQGYLPDSRQPQEYIDKAVFGGALKVLVMHHYLFEPPDHQSEYLLKLKHRKRVFRNLAFADYDLLLCGHKHVPAFDLHTYGEHFDRRATQRYVINAFRRLIGLHSMPVQFEDSYGRRWTKSLTLLTHTLLHKLLKRKVACAEPQSVANVVLNLLRDGLEHPEDLVAELKGFLREHGTDGAELTESHEMVEIQRRIATGLRLEERKKLKKLANKIERDISKLRIRPFLQVMSGSSAKATGMNDRQRTFNVLRCSEKMGEWTVHCDRFIWEGENRRFGDQPLVMSQAFKSNS